MSQTETLFVYLPYAEMPHNLGIRPHHAFPGIAIIGDNPDRLWGTNSLQGLSGRILRFMQENEFWGTVDVMFEQGARGDHNDQDFSLTLEPTNIASIVVYENHDAHGPDGIARFRPNTYLPGLENETGADADGMLSFVTSSMIKNDFNGTAIVRFETEVDRGKVFRLSLNRLTP